MAGILPKCTAREAVQSSKTWTYSLITPAHGHNSDVGDGLQPLQGIYIILKTQFRCSRPHIICSS